MKMAWFIPCLLLSLCSLCPVALAAQDTILTNIRYFTTDRLQQVYAIDNKNQLHKINTSNGTHYEYNNDRLGEIDYLDASNPFALLAFSSEYGTVIVFDRTLNEVATFNLQALDLWDVKAIALSSDNHIWVFDEVNFKLKKIDQQGRVLVASDDLSVFYNLTLRPDFILEKQNQVYVKDPEQGIFVFDVLGGYVTRMNYQIEQALQIAQRRLFYQKDQTIQAIFLDLAVEKEVPLPEEASAAFEDFELQVGYLYLLESGAVVRYNLE